MRTVHPFAEYEVEIRCESKEALFYQALYRYLRDYMGAKLFDGIICSSSLLIQFTEDYKLDQIESAVQEFEYTPSPVTRLVPINIPVCYEDEFALDKQVILEYLKIGWEELIALHTSTNFVVSMRGFVPGFAYLKNLPNSLRIPRKEKPTIRVPQGSVAIADDMTGIYPFNLPGGWHIIGRTPLRLFTPETEKPVLLNLGQLVRFQPITSREFNSFIE